MPRVLLSRLVPMALAILVLPVVPAAAGAATFTAPSVLFSNEPQQTVQVGAGAGHVVAVIEQRRGSALFELAAGAQPRLIASIEGAVDVPTVGTDATGKPVAVLQPCAVGASSRYARARAPCHLRAYDLTDGHSVAIPGTAGAYVGAVDRGRSVSARPSGTRGVRVVLEPAGAGGGRSTTLSLATIERSLRDPLDPELDPSRFAISGLSLARGAVAATVSYATGTGGGSLLLSSARGKASSARPWTQLARSTYGEAGGGPRVFGAPVATPTGVRAFFDGAEDAFSYVGRWSTSGKLVRQINVHGSGASGLFRAGAAFDGDRLVIALEKNNCAFSDDATSDACPVASFGPFPLG